MTPSRKPEISLAAEALWVVMYGYERPPHWVACRWVDCQFRQINAVTEQVAAELAAIVEKRRSA